MGDKGSDVLAAMEMIIQEHSRLTGHDPKHPLLRFICGVSDEGFRINPDPQAINDYVTAYGGPGGSRPIGATYGFYLADLMRANDGFEGTDRLAKPPKAQRPSIKHDPEPFKYDPDDFPW